MTNEELVTAFYESLKSGDVDTFFGIQSDDVVYNISGHSPISGCFRGKQRMINDVLPLVFPKIDADRFEFSRKWKIICADDTTAVCIMEADGTATNGERYDQRYVHIFRFDGGRIVEDGSPGELMMREGGLYRVLRERQVLAA